MNHPRRVLAVAWSLDMQNLYTASMNGAVEIWHVAGWSLVCTVQGLVTEKGVTRWSPDRQLIASARANNTVSVWKLL